MAGIVPVDRLHHVNVVVRDLRAMARNYAEILGVEHWEVRHWSACGSAFGVEVEFGYAAAMGANAQGVTFQLIQPESGFSTFNEFLAARGQGIHGMCCAVMNQTNLERMRDAFRELGVRVVQWVSVDRAAEHHWFDTRQLLGGYFLEVITPRREDWQSAERIDEQWDFTAEVHRPPGVEAAQRIPKVGHFGVAVPDMMRTVEAHATVFGIDNWGGVHFRTAPDSLEFSTLNGAPVKHAWLLSSGAIADFGFEVLQSTEGPTHYKEEFIDKLGGPGIHHLLLLPGLPEADWLPLRAWLESMDVVNCMSGRVAGGSAEFFYMDAREKLGFLVEVIVSHGQPAGSRPGRFTFDYSRRFPRPLK
ncbi:MAG: VOC family protein [Chloroflexi bacterium]|nr:VOC family protein [Chloroflexota bacterium]